MKPFNLYSLFFFKCFFSLPLLKSFVFFSGDGIGVGLTFAQQETHQSSEQQKQQKRIILSHPEDIGLGHTRIIDHLQDLLHKHKPKSPNAYLNTLALSLRHNLCNDDSSSYDDDDENNMDMACHQKMIEIVLKTQPSQREDNLEYIKSILPADFYHHNNEEDDDENKSLLYYLEELFQHNKESSLSLLTSEKYYRETLSKMTHNLSELRTTTTSKKEEENKFNRNIVMIAYSVGIESMKQWREILHDNNNDDNNNVNPFLKYSGLSSGEGRNLQQNSIGLLDTADMDKKFQNVMQADIVGAVEGALTSFFDNQNEEDANGGVGEDTLAAGSTASVKSFVVEFTGVDFGMDSDSDCFFPQQWMCEVDLSGGGEPTADCPYPNLPNCGIGGIPGASDLTSGSDGTDGGNVIVEGISNVGSECLFPAIQNCIPQEGEGGTVPSTPTTTTTTTTTNTNTNTNTQESDNNSISEVTEGVTATTCVLNPTLPWCAGASGSSTSGFGDSDGWVADEQSQPTTSTTTTTTNTQVNNNSNNVVTTIPLFDDDAFDDDSQPANTTPTTTTTTTTTATPPCPYDNPLLCENQDIINAAEGSLESTLGNISENAGSVTLPNPCQFPGNPLCINNNNNNSASSSSTNTNTHSKQTNNNKNNNDLSYGTEYVDHSTEAQKVLEEEKEKQNKKNGGHRLLRHK